MSVTGRSRVAIVAAGLAGLAIVGVLLLGTPAGSGPRLAAPGEHATVSVADSANGPVAMGNGVLMGAALKHDASRPLRELKQYPAHPLQAEDGEGNQHTRAGGAAPHAVDTVVQSSLASPSMPGTTFNFDGIAFPGVVCNCAPPDTNGEVGATQYVQIVNEGYQVWNKATGASVYGPVAITTIWSGFGGVCETAGDGDPVVLYDQLANRWLVSQFAGSGTPTDECIAVSQTSDATGGWFRYDFHLGSNFMDYPHGAVWPDGYYFSFNVFNSAGTSFLGAQPVVFDRAKMLLGQAATFQTIAPLGSNSEAMLPADVDGSTLPPTGAPSSFVAFPGSGAYTTFHYHVDWATPASSAWTTFASPAAAPFTQLCPLTRSCVPQSGTTSGLDALADRPMFRLTYRNFGDHESVVGNFTVSSGGVAGIRWFELRNVTVGPETVYQQSTYQPDTTWRWMGSAAMDHNGDIALGFSASSGSMFPQLRYAGRLAGDPLGTLGQGEATLFSGTGSQTGTSNRWGDYADLTVDPVDDCTFWFTSEYYSTTSSFNWRTRIGAFSMPGCGSSPTTGSISGQVTDTNGASAIAGATVTLSGSGSGTATTDASGNYSFSNLAAGTGYTVTASKSTYTASSSSTATVAVTAGAATTANLTLTSTTGGIAGTVTSTSGGGVISGATVTLGGAGSGSTTTDASGHYAFSGLLAGSYTVTPSKAGFQAAGATNVSVAAGVTTTQDLTLTPNPTGATGWFYIASAIAGPGGDGNGYEGTPGNLLGAPDGALATDANSGKGSSSNCTASSRDKEVASYAITGLGSTILGIEVQLTGKVSSTANTPRFCVQLSWDGGVTWTAGESTATLSTTLATYNLGSAADTWGHAWTPAQLGSGSFRLRITDLTPSSNKTFSLDAVGVRVTYQ